VLARWPARWLSLSALALLSPLLSGCAGTGRAASNEATGSLMAIYSSMPLQGPDAAASQQVVNGEKLALSQAGGRVGPFKIGYVSLDDANPTNGQPSPEVTSTDAKTAAQDTSTIAYLGDYSSAATAVSLPLTNAAGILQVSPDSPYVGLTSSLDAGQDEPERFYLSGRRTFGRLVPSDIVQAAAQVQLMGSLGVHKLYVLDDEDPFEVPLANLVAGDAATAGIKVTAHDSISTVTGASFTGEVEKVVESGAQAVFFAGGDGPGPVALWQALHTADPHLLLLGSSSMTSESFTSQIGAAAASTYLTTPLLPLRLYPPSAQRVLRAYRQDFKGEAGPNVLYGYETMSVVLAAIRSAGDHGNDRQTVIDRFFATHERDSVLGRYSMQANGETTLTRFAVDRVSGGQAVFSRLIEVPLASSAG
jgi:branched-chain amino acid transport system substrate-binding protein